MSHHFDCPTRWEAERQGERAYERGDGSWRNPYHDSFSDSRCPEAERSWQDGHRSAERHAEEQAYEARQARRRAEEREQYRQYEEQQFQQQYEAQQQEYDEEYHLAEEAYYADLWREQFIELPRMADEGGIDP